MLGCSTTAGDSGLEGDEHESSSNSSSLSSSNQLHTACEKRKQAEQNAKVLLQRIVGDKREDAGNGGGWEDLTSSHHTW